MGGLVCEVAFGRDCLLWWVLKGLGLPVAQAGTERLLVDFGLERDRSKRFALWSLLYLLGSAPALDIAFEEEADREAARNFLDLFDAAGPA